MGRPQRCSVPSKKAAVLSRFGKLNAKGRTIVLTVESQLTGLLCTTSSYDYRPYTCSCTRQMSERKKGRTTRNSFITRPIEKPTRSSSPPRYSKLRNAISAARAPHNGNPSKPRTQSAITSSKPTASLAVQQTPMSGTGFRSSPPHGSCLLTPRCV